MERLAKIYRENENFRLILKLFFILLMSRLFMLVLMVIYNVYMGTDRSIAFLMNQWDAKRYQFMIDNGYPSLVKAFPPLRRLAEQPFHFLGVFIFQHAAEMGQLRSELVDFTDKIRLVH